LNTDGDQVCLVHDRHGIVFAIHLSTLFTLPGYYLPCTLVSMTIFFYTFPIKLSHLTLQFTGDRKNEEKK